VQFLDRNPKSKSAQIAAWTMVLTNQVDERTRKFAIERIKALGGKVYITPQGIAVGPPKTD
jgi:NAD-dependent DNA ligase